MPFLAPGELAACGLPDDGITIANPLVAEQSVLRTALLPGLVGAVAYNWSHRNHGVRLFEIGHTFNRPSSPDAELPDERECLGAVLAGLGRHRGGPPVAVRRPRCSAVRRVPVIENGEVPGLHPTRAARILVGDRPGRRGRRDRPRRARGPRHRRARRLPRGRPRHAARPPARRPHVPRLQPVPEQRHRPRLRGGRRRARLRRRGRHPRRRRRPPVERAPLRRLPRPGRGRRPPQPRLHPAPASRRSHPHRRRRRRRSGQQIIDAVQSASSRRRRSGG